MHRSRDTAKIDVCAGCIKLNSSDRQGQKVEDQGHKVK